MEGSLIRVPRTVKAARTRDMGAPEPTPSSTARSAAKATRTALRPNSLVSISTTCARARAHERNRRGGVAHRRPDPSVLPSQGARAEFLRANTVRRIKITLSGPFTMSHQAKNEYLFQLDIFTVLDDSAVYEIRKQGPRFWIYPVRELLMAAQ